MVKNIKKFDKIILQISGHVEFPFKFFDEMVNKRDFLKINNLYIVLQLKSGKQKQVTCCVT